MGPSKENSVAKGASRSVQSDLSDREVLAHHPPPICGTDIGAILPEGLQDGPKDGVHVRGLLWPFNHTEDLAEAVLGLDVLRMIGRSESQAEGGGKGEQGYWPGIDTQRSARAAY